MQLEGQVAIITGAAKGMSGAITRALATEGENLFLAARHQSLCPHAALCHTGDCCDEVFSRRIVRSGLDLA